MVRVSRRYERIKKIIQEDLREKSLVIPIWEDNINKNECEVVVLLRIGWILLKIGTSVRFMWGRQ